MTLRFPSIRSAASATTMVVALLLAGCAGRSLNVTPVEDWSDARSVASTPPPVAPQALYTVQRGDTMASVATRYRTTPASLAAWNNVSPTTRLAPGQVLRVSPPPPPPAIDNGPPAATTSPIGNETVEARPLGPSSTPSPSSSSSSNAPLKTGPLGVKRPYSDAAFAEMSRPDAGDPSASAATPSASTAASTAASTTTPGTAAPAVPATSIAWAWPASGKPLAPFGDGKTKGVDIAGKAGDAVLAAADGKVTFAGTGVRGYGNFVIVRHSPDLLSVYAHNRANLVKEGATVTRGQKIAEMGASDTDGVKLHFEIRSDSKPVDPLKFLPER